MTLSPISHDIKFAALPRLSSGSYSTVFYENKKMVLKASNNLRMDAGLDGDISDDEKNFNGTEKNVLKRSELMEAMILMAIARQQGDFNLLSALAIFLDSFVGQKQFSLVLKLELAHGSLHDLIVSQPLKFTDGQKKVLLQDITKGVAALHQVFGICHGDLKSENILIRVDPVNQTMWRACIADFGLSTLKAFAVHGHAAECYTFGYVPPECCDALTSAPFLIRDSHEANHLLSHVSCFAAPVESNAFVAKLPRNSVTKAKESEKKSLLYCTEVLDKTPTTSTTNCVEKNSTPDFFQRPRQANYFSYKNATKVDFSSDIWALGSIALHLTLLGRHPIAKIYTIIMNSLPFWAQEQIDFQLLHRMEMTAWFFALQEHQFSKDWQKVFDFESVSTDFFKEYCIPFSPKLIDFNLLLKEHSAQELDFIYGCLQFMPNQRSSIDSLCNHAFFQKVSDEKTLKSAKKRSFCSNFGGRLAKKRQLRSNKKKTLLSLVFSRYIESGLREIVFVEMPHYHATLLFLIEICSTFKYSYQSLFLAISYMQFSARRIVPGFDDLKGVPFGWTEKNCKIHAVTCLLLAVSLFEPRHDAYVDVKTVVGHFGKKHEFSEPDIAQAQRLLVECMKFEFEIANVSNFINLALSETNSTDLMPSKLLCSDLIDILCGEKTKLFACSHADLFALALLKKYQCKEAFEHLLSITGHRRSKIIEILL